MNEIKSNIKIGKQIFENVPKEVRPNWGSLILSCFDNHIDKIPTEITELYEIIENKNKWEDAHKQFSKIRKLNLNNSNHDKELYFQLAEKVAKITYNASNKPAPFDNDSGYFISSLALRYADLIDDDNLIQEVKSTILIFNRNKKFKKDIEASNDLILYKKIDNILWFDWDSIGINDVAPRDEYQGYIPEIFRMKKEKASRIEIAEKLLYLETEIIGMPSNLNRCLLIADKIIEI